MAKPKQTNQFQKIIDSQWVGLGLSALTTITFLLLMVASSRYAQIHADTYLKIILGLTLLFVILQVFFIYGYIKNKMVFRKIVVIYGTILLIVSGVGSFYLIRANSLVDQIIDRGDKENRSFAVVNVKDDISKDDLDDKVLGYVLNVSPDFDTVMKETVGKESRTVHYQEYTDNESLLLAAKNGDIDVAVVPERYNALAQSVGLEEDPLARSQVLMKFTLATDVQISEVNVLDEPFSVLMLGINEELSDSMILATFNPKTMTATLTSIARDSYVPIACYPNQSYDKLNHSRGQSRECAISSVENFLDTEVDFFFETDFYALVKIVDALGGIEIDSPATFAGSFPLENTSPIEYEGVTVPEGLNLLDGKQALTFARERHTWGNGDFQRQIHQQYVIRQVANKLLATRDPNKFLAVLDGAKDNITTNLPMKDIAGLMGYALNMTNGSFMGADSFRIISSQITGDPSSTPKGMSIILPYARDVDGARKMIDWNMGKGVELEHHREFGFSINHPYDNFQFNDEFKSDATGFWGDGARLVGHNKPPEEIPNQEPRKQQNTENKETVVPERKETEKKDNTQNGSNNTQGNNNTQNQTNPDKETNPDKPETTNPDTNKPETKPGDNSQSGNQTEGTGEGNKPNQTDSNKPDKKPGE